MTSLIFQCVAAQIFIFRTGLYWLCEIDIELSQMCKNSGNHDVVCASMQLVFIRSLVNYISSNSLFTVKNSCYIYMFTCMV